MTLFSLLIWCVGHEFIVAVDSICQLSLSFQWWFQGLQDSVFAYDLWISIDIAFLTIPCVNHASIFPIDLMCRSWIHLCYQFHTSAVTQFWVMISRSTGLSFPWRFKDQKWHSVFDNSIRQPWLSFRYQFDASVVNSLTLWIPYVSCHSIFSDDYKVQSDSVFGDNLWISHDITFFTILCVGHDSIFAIDSIRQLAFSFQGWFQVLQWISFRWRFMDQ